MSFCIDLVSSGFAATGWLFCLVPACLFFVFPCLLFILSRPCLVSCLSCLDLVFTLLLSFPVSTVSKSLVAPVDRVKLLLQLQVSFALSCPLTFLCLFPCLALGIVLILCCVVLVLSCLVLSRLVLSCLALSCLVLSWSCIVLFYLVLYWLVLYWLASSCVVLSCLVLSCLVLSCLVLPCLVS